MGFLKKNKVPGELPDLILGGTNNYQTQPVKELPQKELFPNKPQKIEDTRAINPVVRNPLSQTQENFSQKVTEYENHRMDEFEEIKKKINEGTSKEESQNGFFDKMLQDINGEIQDLGKLEDWYKTKFFPQDVVSNMRNYWEDNKAEMIIRSFGSEFKERINEKIKILQDLEADWREIYFKLMKKEEEMKKEERILKETLSEFVELCKRRKGDDKKTD